MSELSLRRFNFSLRLLILSWIYLGLFRIHFFQSLANVLYFIPYMLILFIFLYSVVQLRQYMIKPYLFILLNFIFVIFQIAHLYRSDIGVITAIYGYCLYMLPVNLISLSRIIAHTNSVHFFAKSILYATFPNLLMALLQTLVPNSRYSRGIIDEVMQLLSEGIREHTARSVLQQVMQFTFQY